MIRYNLIITLNSIDEPTIIELLLPNTIFLSDEKAQKIAELLFLNFGNPISVEVIQFKIRN